MLELVQDSSLIFGSKAAIDSLAKKESATLLVISDSHGNKEMLHTIVENYGKSSDALIFCGDGIGDLFALFEAAKKHKKIRSFIPPVCAFVRGNGDYEYFPVSFNPDPVKFPHGKEFYAEIPAEQFLNAAGFRLMITHGNAYGVYYGLTALSVAAKNNDADFVFYGHTHVPGMQEIDCTCLINPGSISMPRKSQPPSFALVNIPGRYRGEMSFMEIHHSILDGITFSGFNPSCSPVWN